MAAVVIIMGRPGTASSGAGGGGVAARRSRSRTTTTTPPDGRLSSPDRRRRRQRQLLSFTAAPTSGSAGAALPNTTTTTHSNNSNDDDDDDWGKVQPDKGTDDCLSLDDGVIQTGQHNHPCAFDDVPAGGKPTPGQGGSTSSPLPSHQIELDVLVALLPHHSSIGRFLYQVVTEALADHVQPDRYDFSTMNSWITTPVNNNSHTSMISGRRRRRRLSAVHERRFSHWDDNNNNNKNQPSFHDDDDDDGRVPSKRQHRSAQVFTLPTTTLATAIPTVTPPLTLEPQTLEPTWPTPVVPTIPTGAPTTMAPTVQQSLVLIEYDQIQLISTDISSSEIWWWHYTISYNCYYNTTIAIAYFTNSSTISSNNSVDSASGSSQIAGGNISTTMEPSASSAAGGGSSTLAPLPAASSDRYVPVYDSSLLLQVTADLYRLLLRESISEEIVANLRSATQSPVQDFTVEFDPSEGTATDDFGKSDDQFRLSPTRSPSSANTSIMVPIGAPVQPLPALPLPAPPPPVSPPISSPAIAETTSLSPSPTAFPSAGASAAPSLIITFPVDAASWDLLRWVGLALFLGTCVGTLSLNRLAAWRRHRQKQKEYWSGAGLLATEEGLDSLLQTGWRLQGGSQIEVFDKKKSPGRPRPVGPDQEEGKYPEDEYDEYDQRHWMGRGDTEPTVTPSETTPTTPSGSKLVGEG